MIRIENENKIYYSIEEKRDLLENFLKECGVNLSSSFQESSVDDLQLQGIIIQMNYVFLTKVPLNKYKVEDYVDEFLNDILDKYLTVGIRSVRQILYV